MARMVGRGRSGAAGPTVRGMPTFDRFLRYDELTAELQAMAAEHPDLLQVESIGRSHEGRDIWLATVTDRATGPHDAKPAHWVDANIHATEVTGSVAALHLLHHLVTGFGDDDAVDPRPADAHVLRRAPGEPGRRRARPRGPPAPAALERAALAVAGRPRPAGPATRATSTATAGSSRCASPTRTAPGDRTPTSPAC